MCIRDSSEIPLHDFFWELLSETLSQVLFHLFQSEKTGSFGSCSHHWGVREIASQIIVGNSRCRYGHHSGALKTPSCLYLLRATFSIHYHNGVLCGAIHHIHGADPVSYTHLRAHETKANLVC